jgi:hypothetical protein
LAKRPRRNFTLNYEMCAHMTARVTRARHFANNLPVGLLLKRSSVFFDIPLFDSS